jgi:hypothetical protein
MEKKLIKIDKILISKPNYEIHKECCIIIEFEDNGQDFLEFQINKNGFVLASSPFQSDLWKGAYIALSDVRINEELPIHHPPHINFGYLKHKVKSVKTT